MIDHWTIDFGHVVPIRKSLPTRRIIDEDFLKIRAYVKGGALPKDVRKCDHRVTKEQSQEINGIIKKGVLLKKTNKEIKADITKENMFFLTGEAVTRRIKKFRLGVYNAYR